MPALPRESTVAGRSRTGETPAPPESALPVVRAPDYGHGGHSCGVRMIVRVELGRGRSPMRPSLAVGGDTWKTIVRGQKKR
jgi:hypothetical protein